MLRFASEVLRTDQAAYQERHCGRKRIYLSEAEAELHAKRMHRKKKAKFAHYSCVFCRGWHIGTVRSVRAAIARSERRAA